MRCGIGRNKEAEPRILEKSDSGTGNVKCKVLGDSGTCLEVLGEAFKAGARKPRKEK